MASCNSWQYLVTILAKIFPRSWQDLAKILLRYPWRVDPGIDIIQRQLNELLCTLLMNKSKFVGNLSISCEAFVNVKIPLRVVQQLF